jgi:hypothetical protein
LQKSLIAKLERARASLERGSIAAACALLEAFIAEVQGLAGGAIGETDASSLILAAIRIQQLLGCQK